VEAVAAESRRDNATSERRYTELIARAPDEPLWLGELAGFEDRRGRAAVAIATYRRALALDAGLVPVRVELCRLYNRIGETANAKEQGDAALAAYRGLGNQAGEGQALMCLVDSLRLGTSAQRAEAAKDAQAALAIFSASGYPFNLPRAQYYVGLTTAASGNLAAAADRWEQSLAGARDSGNRTLESLDLMNLGVSHTLLGNRARAIGFYGDGQKVSEALGDERRAAEQRANAAAILIEHSDKPAEGLRDIQNALGVFRAIEDHTFELMALKLAGESAWYDGRHVEAERELNRAVSLAKQWNLDDRVAMLTLELARSKLEAGDYRAALDLAARSGGSPEGGSTDARITMARAHVRLGDLAAARTELARAFDELKAHPNADLTPTLHMALGELAYESGDAREARSQFETASAFWTDSLPDVASVESRSYVGLLDALAGKSDAGERVIQSSLAQAAKMKRFSLEVRSRVQLARAAVSRRAYARTLDVLNDVRSQGERTLNPELEAQVHYWRGRALGGLNQDPAAEAAAARRLGEQARAAVSSEYRDKFAARPDIGVLLR
jgi:hypothetical protein